MSMMNKDPSDSSSDWENSQNEDGDKSQSSVSDLEDSSEDTTSCGLEVFEIQSFMCANNFKLCSYSGHQGSDLFALVLGSGELLFYKFTFDLVGPSVKWIPWFDDSSKKINAITFQSSSAAWLLVASYDCSLHIIPVLSVIHNSEPPNFDSAVWTMNDITTISIQGENVSCENLTPCCLCWWEIRACAKNIGIIGGSNGEILFVDLSSGLCVGTTKVKGEIMSLEICRDGPPADSVFLLITNIHRVQWKVLLKHEESGYSWPLSSFSSKTKDNSKRSIVSFPGARAKIQGFKQLSVEKFNNLRIKLTDNKNRTFSSGESSSSDDFMPRSNIPPYSTVPEPLATDVYYTTQVFQGRHLFSGLQNSSCTISIHSLGLDVRPTLFHKLNECDTHTKYLLTDLFLYMTQNNGNRLAVFSTKLSQYRKGEDTEFNKNSFIQTFTFQEEETVRYLLTCPSHAENEVRDADSSHSLSSQSTNQSKNKICLEDVGSRNNQDTCVIVTNKSVYHLRPRDTPGALVFEYIREQKNLEKSEILAKIFGLDLQMILETVAEKQLEFGNLENAVTLYKLSKCQPLKSVLKLAEAGFTDRLLTYITSLLHQNSQVSNLSLTEKVHLSNLCVMSYTEQLQRSEPSSKNRLEAQFFSFLRQNHSYDENLAVNVAAQSRLCIMLQFLAKYRGLIQEVATVLAKLINYQMQNNTGCPIHFIDGFWDLMSEQCLRESIHSTSKVSSVVLHFIDMQRESLSEETLLKLCNLYDPTHPILKPILKKTLTEPSDDVVDELPLRQWITTFLCLLLQLTASHTCYTASLMNYIVPQTPSDLEDVAERGVELELPYVPLSGGFYHVALVRNRRVHTWGSSSHGILGNGPTMSQISEPEPVVWFRNNKIDVSSVACGRLHTLVLTSSGVYAWGSSEYGQLGIGVIDQSPHPRIIPVLANVRVVSISAGQYHSLAITSQGKLYTWGWGVHGQLGLNTVEDILEPQLVKALEHEIVISAKGGHAHSLALTQAGRVWAFGSGIFGQLGTGSNNKHKVPIELYGLPEPISMIATGYFHNLALGTSNRLYTWGSSPQVLRSQSQAQKRARMMCYSNQVKNTPAELSSDVTSSDISSSDNKAHSGPSASGASEKNEIAEYASFMQSFLCSTDDGMAHMSPTLVDTSHVKASIVQICCGCHHSMLLSREGRVYTWGRNVDGQLGNGSRKEVHTPTAISINMVMTSIESSSEDRSPLLSSTKHISCGGDFSLAMDENGKVWAWGTNVQGQLGKLPVEDLTSKATLEGRLVTFKTSKRVIRLPHGTINMADIPREIPTLPTIRFSYSTMDLCDGHFSDSIVLKIPIHSSQDTKTVLKHTLKRLPSLDSPYSFRSNALHYALEVFHNFYETSTVKSCATKLNNYQAVAKLEMLEKHYDIALKYQLYAFLRHSNVDLHPKHQDTTEGNSIVQCRKKMCEVLNDTVNNNLKCSPIEPELDVRIQIHQSDVSSSVDVENSGQIQSSCDSISDIHMFSLQGGAEELSMTSQDGGSEESDDLLDSPDTMTSLSMNEDLTKPQSLTPSADTKPLHKDHLDNTSSYDLLSATEDLNMNGTDDNVTTEDYQDLNLEQEASISECISELESTSYTTNNKHSSEYILTALKQDISSCQSNNACTEEFVVEGDKKQLVNSVVDIFEFYIYLLNSASDSNILMLLLHEGLSFWLSEDLPVAKLEKLLLKHWDLFAYPLSLLLLSEYELKDKKDLLSGTEMLGKFSTKFNCKLCNSVVEKLSDKGKNYPEFIDMLANITPGSHLYAQSKNSKGTLENTLDLLEATTLPNQFISLQFPQVKPASEGDHTSLSSSSEKIVVFSCGHHYTSELTYLTDIDKFASAMEDRGQINTAQMYKQIYAQESSSGWCGTIQAACPKCIHKLIAQSPSTGT